LGDWIRQSGLPRVDAHALVRAVLGLDRAQQLAHPELLLTAADLRRLDALAARRRAGEPLAYVVGEREFYGLSFLVTPDVLVPRPETELLVELALAKTAARVAPDILDLGTGSGAVAVALAHALPHAQVWALDASDAALAVAQSNARRLLPADRAGGPIHFLRSDWFCVLRGMGERSPRFDCIVSNPPYIAWYDPHLPALRHEPALALTGAHPSADGLHDLRRIAAEAADFLRDDGWLLLEHGYDQSAAVRDLLTTQGFRTVGSARDLAGIERVTFGLCPPRQADGSHPKITATVSTRNSAMSSVHEKIDRIVKSHDVVLFMKGTPQFPMCGFSGRAVQLLKSCGVTQFEAIDVLQDEEIRQGVKEYANWPTIPQLYVKGEFIGGSDIMAEMAQSGELQTLLAGLK
jgi:release factor glutamine methyltransferase